MATQVTIIRGNVSTMVTVTDSTGRNQTATVRNYPAPESELLVRFIDALDVFVYTHDDARVCEHVGPHCGADERTGVGYCRELAPPEPTVEELFWAGVDAQADAYEAQRQGRNMTDREAVGLLTGLSDDELDGLGGFNSDRDASL